MSNSRPMKLLVIGFVWPEPSATAAGVRMLQLLQCFLEYGYEVTFASTASENAHSLDLGSMGIKKRSIRLNDAGFDVFLGELRPNVVIFDRFLTEEQFGWRVAEQCPSAVRILDTEDLHSLRTVRHGALKSGKTFTVADWLKNDITKREVASIYRSDCTLMISTHEMELLENTIKIDRGLLHHIPFLLDGAEIEGKPDYEEREGFICIGNGKHAPNVDAVLWLKKELWPLIRKQLKKAELYIYGAYLPEQINQMHRPEEGFHVMGRVDEVQEVMQKARINLAPLRFGAGIKGKLIEGMLAGTPNITTAIGAEGMHADLPWGGEIADDGKAFADAAVALYQDKAHWIQAQQRGVQIIEKLYNREKGATALLSKIAHIQTNLESHREKNFIGELLQHQSMAGTKYMSKWIEEKNKSIH